MYIIQECIDSVWCDKYRSYDLDFISQMYDNFRTKYIDKKYRLIEVLL